MHRLLMARFLEHCTSSVRFNHRDYVGLEQRLQASGAKQKLIVTDHIFSMDGTLADLAILGFGSAL